MIYVETLEYSGKDFFILCKKGTIDRKENRTILFYLKRSNYKIFLNVEETKTKILPVFTNFLKLFLENYLAMNFAAEDFKVYSKNYRIHSFKAYLKIFFGKISLILAENETPFLNFEIYSSASKVEDPMKIIDFFERTLLKEILFFSMNGGFYDKSFR